MSRKLLVLAMSCEQKFFKEEENVIRHHSYGKNILEGKYPDVDFWTYSASTDGKIHVDKKLHRITVPTDDRLCGTYEKTIMCLKVLETIGVNYDYVFRTNLSTWINVQLVKKFVDEIPDNEYQTIFSTAIYSTRDASGPEPYDFYGVGNSLLLPKFWTDVLKTTTVNKVKKYDLTPGDYDNKSIYKIDDNAIGFIVNVYCQLNGIDKFSVWKSFNDVPQNYDESEQMIYAAIPVRIYNQTTPRECEYDILRKLSERETTLSFDGIEEGCVYISETEGQVVHVIDFEKGTRAIVAREAALDFIKNRGDCDDINEYFKKCVKNNRNFHLMIN